MPHIKRKVRKWFVLMLNALLLQIVQSDIIERDAEAVSPLSAVLQTPEAVDVDQILESARNFLCIPLLRIFSLELRIALQPSENVGLTGDHVNLGVWQVEKAITMRSIDANGLSWIAKVPICANTRIHYRYFIYRTDSFGNRRILRWEGYTHARVMERYEIYRQPGLDIYGSIYETNLLGVESEPGWLRFEYVLQFKFVWDHQINFYYPVNGTLAPRFLLHLTVLQEPRNLVDTNVEVARYAYNNSQYRQQPANGVQYNVGDIVLFRITMPQNSKYSYQLKISTQQGREIGRVQIYAADVRASAGVLKLPIYSSGIGFEIGYLTLPYLVIKPLPNAAELNFRGSFHNYWPLNWPPMDIGHRGAGKSFYKHTARFVENTIESFLFVRKIHGDMVQFDVHLTRDYIPVLYHDYGFYTAPHHRSVRNELDLDYVLIQDLTYKELKEQRIFVKRRGFILEYTHLNVRNTTVAGRFFPTLLETYESLPITLGLVVHIKWPQLMLNDALESWQTLHKNQYVNVILQVTLEFGCGRPLVFASFDADICTMIRHKQNVFPVVLQLVGATSSFQPFRDLRTQTFLGGINFAQSEALLGTAPNGIDFMHNMRLLRFAAALQQVVLVWGNHLNSSEIVSTFRRMHVSGIIYDRMEVLRPQDKRMSLFDSSEMREIYARQCASMGDLGHVQRHVNKDVKARSQL